MLSLLLIPACLLAVAAPDLSTLAERSGFVRTGRMDEVARLCAAFEAAYPTRAHCITFGTTPQGRAMQALVLGTGKGPTVLVQGGIHAGEIDGKDAGFLFAREALEGKLLERVTVVFVPVFNVDGHERFAKNNRPNQRGPEEMGWRTTAQNLNLNRDYMKVDAPEMRAMLALLVRTDPLLYVDLHVTDGAQFQHDVAVLVDPADHAGAMHDAAITLRTNVIARVNRAGHHALAFYPSFEKDDDPASGFAVGVAPPRFSQPYWALHGRMGMLVETHSWHDYQARVLCTRDILRAILDEATLHADEWTRAAQAADAPPALHAPVELAWESTGEAKPVDFLGYAYVREPSSVSGALKTTYDETKPQVWRVPLATAVKPTVVADAPFAYVVPAEHAAWVRDKLDAHGIAYQAVGADHAAADVSVFRATEVKLADKSFEGHQGAKLKGAWTKERRAILKGALVVPVHQRLGVLAMQLFEPTAPDALVSWGFFNAAFEQKEYMESYVAEDVAAHMLKDPKVRAEFAAKLEADPAFAKDPDARLDWFYRRHPSWDERRDLYPVFRLESGPLEGSP